MPKLPSMGNQRVSDLDRTTADRLDRHVEAAIARINQMWRTGVLSAVVAIGDYVIQQFFEGDLELASSQNPNKSASFNKLLEREKDLPFSSTSLRRMVFIAVQYHQMPLQIADRLSRTQHEKLLRVQDPQIKLQLAEEAIAR